jgi:uncharacterized SAM-binding protein YcdF (DUF218 family)
MLVVCATPLVSWWATQLAGPWDDPKGDVLIVPGGSLLDPGLMGVNSYWRSIYALQAWRTGGFHDILITGGSDPRTPIAALMSDFLKSQGVPATAIHVETRSNSTYENAAYSKPLLDQLPGTKVLLTSDYHMYRAHRVFEKAGIHVLPRPFPDARKRGTSWIGRWPAFWDVSVESVKIAYYRWKNWI